MTMDQQHIEMEEKLREQRQGYATIIACLLLGVVGTVISGYMILNAPRTNNNLMFSLWTSLILCFADTIFMISALQTLAERKARKKARKYIK